MKTKPIISLLTCGLMLSSSAVASDAVQGAVNRTESAVPTAGLPAGWIKSHPRLTSEEAEAMEFLYSSMVLADRGNHEPDFYLQNVRSSLQAREEMPWGKSVPKREFMHFVLPDRKSVV